MCKLVKSESGEFVCYDTGLPLTVQTKFGEFCVKRCGFAEAKFIHELSTGRQLKLPQTNSQIKRTDVLPLAKESDSSASRYITAIHLWIEKTYEELFSNKN